MKVPQGPGLPRDGGEVCPPRGSSASSPLPWCSRKEAGRERPCPCTARSEGRKRRRCEGSWLWGLRGHLRGTSLAWELEVFQEATLAWLMVLKQCRMVLLE